MEWPSSDHRAQTQSRSRRRVLQAVLGAGVGGFAGLAGCTSRGETGASTPTAAVENYFAALEAGNRQRANRYAHADGEYAIGEEPSGPLAAALDADTITIEGPNEVALETAVRNRCREVDREFQSVATVLERERVAIEAIADEYGFDEHAYIRHEAAVADGRPTFNPTFLLFGAEGWAIWSRPTQPALSNDKWLDDG